MSKHASTQVRPVLIMAGGTGGHVFPALAVAHEILARNIPVIWLGTKQGIEARLIPAEGIPVEWVSVSGLRGKRLTRLLKAPFMLTIASWQCFRVLMRIKPQVVLGMGGFVTGPGGVMARLMGKPLCIHEQNAIAGMTNRYLSRIASCVAEAFPGSFPDSVKTILTGNPVRKDISSMATPEERFESHSELHRGQINLLVLGGSLGAQALNEILPLALAELPQAQRPQVRHQVGERNIEQAHECYNKVGLSESVELTAFVDDMAGAYEWADLVICRAGALTIAELTAAGIASILVPYPYAVDDHQTRNAMYLVDANAGILIQQSELDAEVLSDILTKLTNDREKLLQMACAARSLSKPDATRQLADICLDLGAAS